MSANSVGYKRHFGHEEDRYWEGRLESDLLAVGQYWGELCVLYGDALPEDLEEIMAKIVESVG